MTTDQLLTSGVLETYLLGLASDEEQAAIGHLLDSRPELTDYLYDLDTDLGSFFAKQAVPPPPAIRDVLELRVMDQSLQKRSRATQYDYEPRADHQHTAAKPNYVDVEVDNTHIRVHKYWRPAFIAVFILGKIFLATGLYFYFKADSQAQEISRLKAEIHQSVRK